MIVLSFCTSAAIRPWKALTLLWLPPSHGGSTQAEAPAHVMVANPCPAVVLSSYL